MQYRRFGRTELPMPVFSCGGMRYQQSWKDVAPADIEASSQRNVEAIVARALELGLNHFETAHGYGASERQLGMALADVPRDKLIVQTKVLVGADSGLFRQQFLESLDRLGMDHVDLLGLHGVNNYEAHWHAVRPRGCLQAARELQAEGRVRHVGFSTHGPLQQILDTLNTDTHGGFDYINLHWYYICQWNWPAIEAARARDMGVFIISPNDKGGLLYRPSAKLLDLCRPLHPIVFNALFCLSRPEVHTLSLGASRPTDFDLQASVVELLPRAAELLPPILERLKTAMREATGQEYADGHSDGLPSWEHGSPFYLNAPIVLWLRNLALGFDMLEFAKMRYNLLGRGGNWLAGMPAAHIDAIPADELARAFQKSPHAEQIPAWLREAHQMLHGPPAKRLTQS